MMRDIDALSIQPERVTDYASIDAVYLRQGAVVDYSRVHGRNPQRPRMFLAQEHAVDCTMAAIFIPQPENEQTASELILPRHPASAAALGQATYKGWDAAMACALRPSPLDDYLTQIKHGHRPPGRIIWPVAFDLNM